MHDVIPCRLDPVPGTDEPLIKGRTRLAAIIDGQDIIEIDPKTGRAIAKRPLPMPEKDHGRSLH